MFVFQKKKKDPIHVDMDESRKIFIIINRAVKPH